MDLEAKCKGLECALRLLKIELTHAKLEFWRERYSHAAHQIGCTEKRLKHQKKVSEGGERCLPGS